MFDISFLVAKLAWMENNLFKLINAWKVENKWASNCLAIAKTEKQNMGWVEQPFVAL